jgi:hypothetical protein
VVCAALVVLHTWPLALAPHRLTRHDNADTMLNEWIVAWVAHQIPRAPLALFDANIFHPERRTLAFSEHLVVPALMGAPLHWAGVSPPLVYNLLLMLGFGASAWAMWRMLESWTGSALAGLVAGSLYAFNAHTLTRLPHVQALHLEFLPFAWLALDRLLKHPGRRDAALLGVFAALQALTSNYLLVFTALALALSVLCRPSEWLRPWRPRTAGYVLAAGALGAVLVGPFLVPYLLAQREQGLTRSLEEVALYSSTWRDYAATAGLVHYAAWSHRVFDGATALFPGLSALLLALLAIVKGGALADPRARMVAVTGFAGLVLSFGPTVPGYAWLYDAFPLLQGVRGAARFGFLALIAVAVLAGYGVAWIDQRLRHARARIAVAAAIILLIHGEAWRGPIAYRAFDGIPAVYRVIAREPHAVVAEFPFFPVEGVFRNASYVLNSTAHWKPLVNGYSGFTPASYVDNARALHQFPDERSRARLAQLGVTHLVVHLDAYGGRRAALQAALAATPWLRLIASDGEVRVYRTGGWDWGLGVGGKPRSKKQEARSRK